MTESLSAEGAGEEGSAPRPREGRLSGDQLDHHNGDHDGDQVDHHNGDDGDHEGHR